MGLIYSALVFFVGVVEALSCFRHIDCGLRSNTYSRRTSSLVVGPNGKGDGGGGEAKESISEIARSQELHLLHLQQRYLDLQIRLKSKRKKLGREEKAELVKRFLSREKRTESPSPTTPSVPNEPFDQLDFEIIDPDVASHEFDKLFAEVDRPVLDRFDAAAEEPVTAKIVGDARQGPDRIAGESAEEEGSRVGAGVLASETADERAPDADAEERLPRGCGAAEEAPVTGKVEEAPSQEAFWLIFSGEYTKAMSKDWHSGHFSCWQCDEALTGQRYVLRDDHPYCIKCYESVFANVCEECNKIIGIDSKDLSYKDKHWHEICFLCNKCRISLVDKQFGSKADKIYCGNCYDAQFASRCDGCGEIFRAGTKKMEYKTRQWHEKCFCCCVCKSPIGTRSFIPREQEIYCALCYEEKFATRCVKCNKIITSGGVTYKNEPWHRECFTCTNCSTSLAGQRFTSRDEKPYCADCFGELFAKRCTSCSKPITGIGGTRFISFENRHWHNDCFICASCKTSLVGRGFITDGEDIICPECAKQKLM